MPYYDVKITATVTKTIRVEADSEDEAEEEAHESFTVAPDTDGQEKYDQETDHVNPIPDCRVTGSYEKALEENNAE